jgi:hypothetical protein
MLRVTGGSGEDGRWSELLGLTAPSLGDTLQLTFDRAGSRKCPAVQFFEVPVGRIEDESASQPHGNSDGTTFKFDDKSLHGHGLFSWRAPGRADQWSRRGRSLIRWLKMRSLRNEPLH